MNLSSEPRAQAIESLLTAAFVVSLAALSSCTSDPDTPTPLIDPLKSRMAIGEVQAILRTQEPQWKATTERIDRKPNQPHEVSDVQVEGFSDLGVTGRLWLTFFDGKLMKTTFFPEDLARYRSRLEVERRIRFGPTNESNLPPNTRIWIDTTSREYGHVAWEDVALTIELQRAATG